MRPPQPSSPPHTHTLPLPAAVVQALIFSSMHVSGEQLKQLSGIAALLRFPLPDLEDMEIPDEQA